MASFNAAFTQKSTLRNCSLLCVVLFLAQTTYTATEISIQGQEVLTKVSVCDLSWKPVIHYHEDQYLDPNTVTVQMFREGKVTLVYRSDRVFFKVPRRRIAMSFAHFLRLLDAGVSDVEDQAGEQTELEKIELIQRRKEISAFKKIKNTFFCNDGNLKQFAFGKIFEIKSTTTGESGVVFSI